MRPSKSALILAAAVARAARRRALPRRLPPGSAREELTELAGENARPERAARAPPLDVGGGRS